MKINKEIIEKYHQGNCSPAEKDFVENWLINDEVVELHISDEEKSNLKNEMWADIADFIAEQENKELPLEIKPVRKISFIKDLRKIAAALIILSVCVVAVYKTGSGGSDLSSNVLLDNSGEDLKKIDGNSFLITLGPKSYTRIDLEKGLIDSNGSILFSPKKDLELSVKGFTGKVKFKNGETYIVMGSYTTSDKLMIINEKDILNLPPVIQRQLTTQFNI